MENEKSGRDGLDFSSLKKLNIRGRVRRSDAYTPVAGHSALDPGPDVMDSSSKYLAGPFVAVQILVQASDLAFGCFLVRIVCHEDSPEATRL